MSYRPYEPQQEMLLPAWLQDWLPKGHLANFISYRIDVLDLKAVYARYEGGCERNQPFHPAMRVKVLVYGCATGVFSSRKIERRLHEDLAFRTLGAGNFPKHPKIRGFRALHLKECPTKNSSSIASCDLTRIDSSAPINAGSGNYWQRVKAGGKSGWRACSVNCGEAMRLARPSSRICMFIQYLLRHREQLHRECKHRMNQQLTRQILAHTAQLRLVGRSGRRLSRAGHEP